MSVVAREVYSTLTPDKHGEAGAHLVIQAVGSIQAADEASTTGAHIAPNCVCAVTPGAEPWHTKALISIFTLGASGTEMVSSGAVALKGTHCIDTAATLAQA